MVARRTLLVLVAVASATVGLLSAACSSSDSGTSGTSGTSGSSGNVDSGADVAIAADAAPVDTIPPGSVQLAEGPCVDDSDCAPNARGTVACFVGGMGTGGGGGGDGGSDAGPAAYCTLKCSPPGVANTTVCAAPFLEFCNMRGYCKLH